jgi:thiol-disulfide isomerase/thioredoxin
MKRLLSISLLLLSCSTLCHAGDTAKVGQAAPKLASLLPDATIPATAGKVVLVDFWASWCAPCKASFPVLNGLQKSYTTKGLVIVGIGVDDDPADYKKFATKMGATFTLVHDAAHKGAAAFSPATMPSSYLIDRKGVVRFVHAGFKGGSTEAEYIKEIELLLSEK